MAAFEPKTAVAIEVAAGVSVCAYLAAHSTSNHWQ